jgi:tetraacyldisaccharide 4'-kinase
MDQQTAKEIMSCRRGGAGASCVRAATWLASKPYALAMHLRRWGYRRGVLASHDAPVPVISVGNLTTGGTGKTPMVAWIVRHLTEAGRKPAIVMRGYRAGKTAPGAEPRSDEAELLAKLTGCPVIVEPDRLAGARRAADGGCNVVILDDGFQHRRLRRQLDIVLIDAVEPLGFGHCLPRGLLREPPAALADADAVVITHADEVTPERLAELRRKLAALCNPSATIAQAAHKPVAVIDDAGRPHPPTDLAERAVAAFCGLGSPEHFFASLARLRANVVAAKALDDHAAYSPAILAELSDQARAAGAEIMITTQKDHVRLAHPAVPQGARIWQLAIEIDVTAGRDELLARVDKAATDGKKEEKEEEDYHRGAEAQR